VTRVFGIEIRIHASFLLIVGLFWLAGTAEGGLGVGNAMIWLALIFGSVTAHELAHSVVARRRGIDVRAIVLLPIGGVSEMERMPDRPKDEFAIAGVGPALSLAIAAVGLAATALAGLKVWPPDLGGGALLPRVAWLNLVLGVFNLLPAFPMDGGRLLRSIIERRTSLERATRIAARVGRNAAIVMGLAGILWSPWLLVIALFVYFGASAEESATVLHVRMEGLTVADVMLREPLTIDQEATVDEIQELARRTAQDDFPVTRYGRYMGMLTGDVLDRSRGSSTAGSLATAVLPLAPGDDLESDALPRLSDAPTEAIAVVDNGDVVGTQEADDHAA